MPDVPILAANSAKRPKRETMQDTLTTVALTPSHRIEINRKATRVGTFEVCVSTHVSLRMFIMQVLASQLPFLANRNAELAVPPLFWPDNCIKIGGHVALLSGPTVYTVTERKLVKSLWEIVCLSNRY